VSGDKDVHGLGQHGNVPVIKVADMLDIISGERLAEARALIHQRAAVEPLSSLK